MSDIPVEELYVEIQDSLSEGGKLSRFISQETVESLIAVLSPKHGEYYEKKYPQAVWALVLSAQSSSLELIPRMVRNLALKLVPFFERIGLAGSPHGVFPAHIHSIETFLRSCLPFASDSVPALCARAVVGSLLRNLSFVCIP